jgi:hypothetical protein
VGDCIKSWGRRGILAGSLVGFALAMAFVAAPHTTTILALGVVGTLIVGAVEGAVIAGAFGACAAALYGKGVLRGSAASLDRTLSCSRRAPAVGWRDGDIPASDWPTRWTYPVSAAAHHSNER